jgi:hypothetical protein
MERDPRMLVLEADERDLARPGPPCSGARPYERQRIRLR